MSNKPKVSTILAYTVLTMMFMPAMLLFGLVKIFQHFSDKNARYRQSGEDYHSMPYGKPDPEPSATVDQDEADDFGVGFDPLDQEDGEEEQKEEEEEEEQEKEKEYMDSDNDLMSAYRKLLGLGKKFTKAELKSAYRQALKANHPDNFDTMPTHVKIKAEEATKMIIEAFDFLAQSRASS